MYSKINLDDVLVGGADAMYTSKWSHVRPLFTDNKEDIRGQLFFKLFITKDSEGLKSLLTYKNHSPGDRPSGATEDDISHDAIDFFKTVYDHNRKLLGQSLDKNTDFVENVIRKWETIDPVVKQFYEDNVNVTINGTETNWNKVVNASDLNQYRISIKPEKFLSTDTKLFKKNHKFWYHKDGKKNPSTIDSYQLMIQAMTPTNLMIAAIIIVAGLYGAGIVTGDKAGVLVGVLFTSLIAYQLNLHKSIPELIKSFIGRIFSGPSGLGGGASAVKKIGFFEFTDMLKSLSTTLSSGKLKVAELSKEDQNKIDEAVGKLDEPIKAVIGAIELEKKEYESDEELGEDVMGNTGVQEALTKLTEVFKSLEPENMNHIINSLLNTLGDEKQKVEHVYNTVMRFIPFGAIGSISRYLTGSGTEYAHRGGSAGPNQLTATLNDVWWQATTVNPTPLGTTTWPQGIVKLFLKQVRRREEPYDEEVDVSSLITRSFGLKDGKVTPDNLIYDKETCYSLNTNKGKCHSTFEKCIIKNDVKTCNNYLQTQDLSSVINKMDHRVAITLLYNLGFKAKETYDTDSNIKLYKIMSVDEWRENATTSDWYSKANDNHKNVVGLYNNPTSNKNIRLLVELINRNPVTLRVVGLNKGYVPPANSTHKIVVPPTTVSATSVGRVPSNENYPSEWTSKDVSKLNAPVAQSMSNTAMLNNVATLPLLQLLNMRLTRPASLMVGGVPLKGNADGSYQVMNTVITNQTGGVTAPRVRMSEYKTSNGSGLLKSMFDSVIRDLVRKNKRPSDRFVDKLNKDLQTLQNVENKLLTNLKHMATANKLTTGPNNGIDNNFTESQLRKFADRHTQLLNKQQQLEGNLGSVLEALLKASGNSTPDKTQYSPIRM
jgi:hypothetical protein